MGSVCCGLISYNDIGKNFCDFHVGVLKLVNWPKWDSL